MLRNFIEAVKHDDCTTEIKNQFVDFVRRNASGGIILGCTELPVLHDKCKTQLGDMNFYDPMLMALETLYAEFEPLRKEQLSWKITGASSGITDK